MVPDLSPCRAMFETDPVRHPGPDRTGPPGHRGSCVCRPRRSPGGGGHRPGRPAGGSAVHPLRPGCGRRPAAARAAARPRRPGHRPRGVRLSRPGRTPRHPRLEPLLAGGLSLHSPPAGAPLRASLRAAPLARSTWSRCTPTTSCPGRPTCAAGWNAGQCWGHSPPGDAGRFHRPARGGHHRHAGGAAPLPPPGAGENCSRAGWPTWPWRRDTPPTVRSSRTTKSPCPSSVLWASRSPGLHVLAPLRIRLNQSIERGFPLWLNSYTTTPDASSLPRR